MILAETTPITIDFPNWFYGLFSCGIIVFIAWAAFNYCKIREICKEFPKIRRALDLISQLLLSHEWTQEHLYISSKSPLSLTPNGEEMLKSSGFEDFFKANKDKFFLSIYLQNPKSEADVEKVAKDLMIYLDTDKTAGIEFVKNFAYEYGRSMAVILFAYSIEIRDRYLKEHPFK